MLGLRFCARAFSSCGKRGPLFIAVRGPYTITASLVAENRLQTRRLGNCGSRAQLLCGMWDLPRPGLEPVSLALAGRFSTTAPPGKPLLLVLEVVLSCPGQSPQSRLDPIPKVIWEAGNSNMNSSMWPSAWISRSKVIYMASFPSSSCPLMHSLTPMGFQLC